MENLFLEDRRIGAKNILTQLKAQEYIKLLPKFIEANEFQRRRMKSAAPIYGLLRDDLQAGCVIPPIVLAYVGSKTVEEGSARSFDMLEFLKENSSEIRILDGLQRSYTLLDMSDDPKISNETWAGLKIRIELYLGINKLGILYRMLTLNTGQTPMSLRHQIEMLYSIYQNGTIGGVRLIREVDESRARQKEEYKFSDIIEGFNSYIERDELPIEKFDVIETVTSLEKLARENKEDDLFGKFVSLYHSFFLKIYELSETWEISAENKSEYPINPFGISPSAIFKKSQVITGFGAAVGKLKDFGIISHMDDILTKLPNLRFQESKDIFYLELLRYLEKIRESSKKIGNSQRMFFTYFFRELLNQETDSYLMLDSAVRSAYKKYASQT